MAVQVGAAPPQDAGGDPPKLSLTSVQVEDGTAQVGRDFSHSSAGLVQFDPGESE